MKKLLIKIFPATVTNEISGYKIATWTFMLLSIISAVRSCIHLLAPDGGAATIAGLDLSQGAVNVIFAFGLWGLSQLIYALIQLLVAFRYRKLVPFMYLLLIFETVGRMAIGHVKPPIVLHTVPGGVANYILLPLAILMFILSLVENKPTLSSNNQL